MTELIQMVSTSHVGILITDHNVLETLNTCTWAQIMNEGVVIASDSAEQILDDEGAKRFYLGENFII